MAGREQGVMQEGIVGDVGVDPHLAVGVDVVNGSDEAVKRLRSGDEWVVGGSDGLEGILAQVNGPHVVLFEEC